MISCIIIDDELKSRESLKILLQDFCSNVEVKSVCQNIAEATNAIIEHKPDVIFLDIHLQRETGFDLLTKLKDVNFEVIFTTAYAEYAIKAFKFSAIDYLLKPIDIEELKQSLSKVEKSLNNNINARLQQLMQNLRMESSEHYKLALPSSDGLIFVKASDIMYCEASSNYTQIVMTKGNKYTVSRTLKEYEDLLNNQNFYRIHNSYLVNLNYVKKYVRGDGGYVIMHDDRSLDVSKRKKDGFLVRIGAKE